MNAYRYGIVGGLLLLSCVTGRAAGAITGTAAKTVAQLERRTLPNFQIPRMTRRTLSNGMRCYFLEDHALPLWQFRILLPAGSVFDPADAVGLNAMTLHLLRNGGTRTHPADAVDAALDQQAIQIGFDAGVEVSSANVSGLRSVQEEALQWFMELLFTPAFEAGRVDLVQGQMIEELRRQNDQPAEIVQREYRKVLYGATSPWARTPSRATVGAVTAARLQEAHAAMLTPDQWVCAAAGDLVPEAFVRTVERLMARYPQRAGTPRMPPSSPAAFQPHTYLAAKAAAQAALTIGHRGGDRFSPDKYALVVMNEILGSSHTFTSWLTSTIRTAKGLAYEVWSSYGFGPTVAPGVFQIHAKTRPEKVGEVVRLAQDAVRRLADGVAITESEMTLMKESILKRSIFEYEEPFNIVAETARFVFLGLPEDYLQRFHEGIKAVRLEDVRRVARTYLHPEALQVFIVGEPRQMGPWLRLTAARRPYALEEIHETP